MRAECRNPRKANILEKLIRETEVATENGKLGECGVLQPRKECQMPRNGHLQEG